VSKAASTLSKPFQPKNEKEFGKIRLSLLNAGFRSDQAVHIYLGIKFVLMLVGLAVAVPLAYAKFGLSSTSLGFMLLGTGIGCYLPNVVVGYIKKKRQEAIFFSLPDALDLMVVCVEAGLGLDSAMRRVTAEMSTSSPVLCEEYALSNFQLQMGRPRRDVLHELGTRTGVNDLRALAAVLIQAERFGSSVATALRVQSDSMRTRRRQLAEERAAKTAVQLIFPLVLFIFPGIFVVLVGPAAIQIIKSLFK
jgi:tight adherence protein C